MRTLGALGAIVTVVPVALGWVAPQGCGPHRRAAAAAVAAAIVLLLALTGCGSSSQSARSSFVSKANAICKAETRKGRRLGRRLSAHSASKARVTEKLKALEEWELSRLERVTPPPNLRAEYRHYLRVTRTAVKRSLVPTVQFLNLEATYFNGTRPQARRLARKIKADFKQDVPLAQKLGLNFCAHPNGSKSNGV